jgi:hypothetical protein
MSELDELGDIADQCAISVHGLAGQHTGKKPFQVPCASQDHLKPPNIRFYCDAKGRKRYVCTLCEKVRKKRRRRGRPTYGMQGYPL